MPKYWNNLPKVIKYTTLPTFTMHRLRVLPNAIYHTLFQPAMRWLSNYVALKQLQYLLQTSGNIILLNEWAIQVVFVKQIGWVALACLWIQVFIQWNGNAKGLITHYQEHYSWLYVSTKNKQYLAGSITLELEV